MTPNCVDIVTFGPELTTPELLFHLRVKLENLLGRDAFDRFNDFARTHRWDALDQKMNMIFVRANFNELNLVPHRYLKADILQALVYSLTKYKAAIFRRAYKVVKKYWYIVTLMDKFTHITKVIIFSKQSFGELNPWEN